MWDGHVEEEEVDGGVGEEGVTGYAKFLIVAGVLADIATFVGG
jgi:hypothetical protein